ncbi:hypothetical protein HDU96_005244 [Phlyctochytrium bullatum]|nr:hypothetical protein HDU96_005244 [Phlyctochytrium bullatum]
MRCIKREKRDGAKPPFLSMSRNAAAAEIERAADDEPVKEVPQARDVKYSNEVVPNPEGDQNIVASGAAPFLPATVPAQQVPVMAQQPQGYIYGANPYTSMYAYGYPQTTQAENTAYWANYAAHYQMDPQAWANYAAHYQGSYAAQSQMPLDPGQSSSGVGLVTPAPLPLPQEDESRSEAPAATERK